MFTIYNILKSSITSNLSPMLFAFSRDSSAMFRSTTMNFPEFSTEIAGTVGEWSAAWKRQSH